MAFPIQKDLRNLSAAAKELSAQIEKGALVTDENITAVALGRVQDQIQALLLKNLKTAITQTKEFNTPELKDHLLTVFSNPEIIRADAKGRLNLFTGAENIAGSWTDFDDGIRVVRQELNISRGGTPEERSRIWRDLIYRPAREGAAAPVSQKPGTKKDFRSRAKEQYERTIEARLIVWGNLAPFWLILNYGNTSGPIGKGGTPYPNNPPTFFLENTEDQGNAILKASIEQVNREMENIIFEELEAFGRRRVRPLGEIIREFFVAGQPYKLYITPKRGILGVRRG